MDKQRVTRAFEALGATRVERGLLAFDDCDAARNFSRCFMGLAQSRWYPTPLGYLGAIAVCVVGLPFAALGVSERPFTAVASWLTHGVVYGGDVAMAFDAEPRHLEALAREWLEAHPSRVVRARRALSGVQNLEEVAR